MVNLSRKAGENRVERLLNVGNVFPVEKRYSVGGRFARAFTQQPGSDVGRMAGLAYARNNRVYHIAENTSSVSRRPVTDDSGSGLLQTK
ncbi:hypothetical protein DPMN_040208 [Dreissena polymorpha]|uniref:Uncharacterized protein n=1 Tax=Dreissena polymorpha TaxID=45954 RepID=A0A9D4CX97_DREPO|nr:hypothetical protein DPMN_040208 [Dreissena polymorpha]